MWEKGSGIRQPLPVKGYRRGRCPFSGFANGGDPSSPGSVYARLDPEGFFPERPELNSLLFESGYMKMFEVVIPENLIGTLREVQSEIRADSRDPGFLIEAVP